MAVRMGRPTLIHELDEEFGESLLVELRDDADYLHNLEGMESRLLENLAACERMTEEALGSIRGIRTHVLAERKAVADWMDRKGLGDLTPQLRGAAHGAMAALTANRRNLLTH